jgi:hypothetical protein
MRTFVPASLLALVLAISATPALAFPHVNVTASETISTVPPRYKTTFTVELVGYNPPAAWYGVELSSSGQGAPVTFYATECPAYPWSCSNNSTLAWYYRDGGGLGGPATQFSVTTDQQVPCLRIRIPDMLLAKTPTPRVENDYVITACLAVDMPTPAGATTWGSLKAIYR